MGHRGLCPRLATRRTDMSEPRRVGLWLIGALGGVGSTVALGLAALRRSLAGPAGLVTELPLFAPLALDSPAAFPVGGHDIRAGNRADAAAEVGGHNPAFPAALVDACRADLDAWSAEVRPG